MKKRLRQGLKRLSFEAFLVFERLGVHVLPAHYYSSLPNHGWLRRHPELWQSALSLKGIEWNLDKQLRWLRQICSEYYREVQGLGPYARLKAAGFGLGFGPIESQVLHCFVRSQAPTRVVEVGAGLSTAIIRDAGELNAREGRCVPEIRSIEPFPSPALKRLGGVEIIQESCQAVQFDVFEQLQAGDLLFIDSTHAVKCGSELIRLYLEVLPRLAAGAVVHVHDIYLPFAYSRTVLSSYFDWQETSLVAALLTHNSRIEILCCQSGLHYERPGDLATILPDYRPQPNQEGLSIGDERESNGHFPSSLWLVTKAEGAPLVQAEENRH